MSADMQRSNAEVRPVGIRSFVVEDIGEKHSPPTSPLLHVQLLPDRAVSLSIESYEETSKTITYTRQAQVIVDLEPLMNGLRAALASEGAKNA